eukprot:1974588-Prymnesium_polylepis.2
MRRGDLRVRKHRKPSQQPKADTILLCKAREKSVEFGASSRGACPLNFSVAYGLFMMRRVAVADATRALRCPGWHEIR